MNRFSQNGYLEQLLSKKIEVPIALALVMLFAGIFLIILLVLQVAQQQFVPPENSPALSGAGGTVLPTSTSLRSPTRTPQPSRETSTPNVAGTPTHTEQVQEEATATGTPEAMSEVREPYIGIWISAAELARLPTSGAAWEQLKTAADQELDEPKLRNKDESNNIYLLAKALVYARTGESRYREEIIDNLMQAIDTEDGGRTLALSRNLLAYVVAADLVNLPADPEKDTRFREWLRHTLTEELDGLTLQTTHEERPNNWGTHAGASRVAVAWYLQDEAELERAARVFKGWLGDREAYAEFSYGDLSWQADPDNPVGVNPKGAMKEGHSIDGALPEEMRRGGGFRWPPRHTNYPWGAMQGALVQAEILCRAGYPAWEWEDRALLRAAEFLYGIGWVPTGDDEWQPWLLNNAYGTEYPTKITTQPGKNMGWTDWTHSEFRLPRSERDGC